MAADQRKKPVTTIRIAATSHDQGKLKKNSSELIPYARSNIISLEWDDKNKSVVAKREQIGLSKRHLVSFDSFVYHYPNVLADVLTLPQEVFEQDILKKVFSYEVWQTLLSVNDRHYLMQFLPEGVDMHKVVQELLVGHINFHFGNPFFKWSASLCSGNFHPDAILQQERCLRASKKTYYIDLVNYHNGMINSLLMWKERWATSKHPEEKVLQEMWKSRKQAGNMSSDENEYKIYKVKEDVAGTSESASSVDDENSGSSDNENLVTRDRDLQKGKVTPEDRFNNLAAGLKVLERFKKGERLHKQNIRSRDGSKYMSYIKVSRKQHQRVKSSMKHSSNSIQSRSLNRVLGDLHSFHVQPFKVFVEEEQKKLHAHWLQLSIKDVPAAFANFRRFQLAKSQLPLYWKQEMKEKFVSLDKADREEEKDNPHIMSPAFVDNGASSNEAADAMEIEEKEQADCFLQEHSDDRAKSDKLKILSGVVKKTIDSTAEEVMNDKKGSVEPASEHENQFASNSMQNQHLPKIMELTSGERTCPIEADSNSYVVRERDDSRANASEYSENVGVNAVGQDSSLSTSDNVWPLASIRNSYHHLTSNFNVGSLHLLSPGYPGEHQSRMINLESDNDKDVSGNNLWHKQSQDGSSLSPYAADRGVRGQNELLRHHYLNLPDVSYHNHEQTHSQFELQASSSVPVGRSQYPGCLGEHLNMPMPLIDLMREKSLNERELTADHNIIRDRMFSAERFRNNSILMQQHLSSAKNIQQDWAANTTSQTLSPFQSRLSLGELVPNRVMGDDQIRGGWSNLESSSHVDGFINRSSIEESLYGAGLSHYNNSNITELPYAAPFDSVQGPAQRLIGSGFGYGGGGVSLVHSGTINDLLLEPQRDLLSSQVATSLAPDHSHPLVTNNNPIPTGWVDIPPHQNSDIHDSLVKPFSRPWNS